MFNRYKLSELSFPRLYGSLRTRVSEIPHWLAWNMLPFAFTVKDQIKRFEDLHKGKRCFIVANGPSLKKTDLSFLFDEITFGMNRIYLMYDQSAFRPTYYVTMNELILEQFSSDIQSQSMPMFLNWNRRKFFDLTNPNVIFLKSKMVIKDFFQFDLTRPIVVGGTVTFVALQLAYYMGFEKVILVGLDHNYVEKGVPSGLETRQAEQDQSHFHPQYFPKGSKWQLPDLLRSEIDFSLARRAFEADGRKVYDATLDGKCEVFEKIDYLSLFK